MLPPLSKQVEYEGEIGVVIGQRLRARQTARRPQRRSRGIVAVERRDRARSAEVRRQWTRAKGFDTFCPVGEPAPAPSDLATLDGSDARERRRTAARQRASDMVFSIPDVLSYISQVMTLEPGDLVLTGTPAGVGKLRSGDEVEVEVARREPSAGTLSTADA